MQYRYPDYLNNFRCLAGDCPDTCCGGWEIVIDEQTARRYEELDGPLGEKLRASMVREEGEICLKLQKGRCPMLTQDNLCALITAHGTQMLSITCDSHPRFTEIYGGLEETALAVSCPAAAELLLEREEKMAFSSHADDAVPQPNDLDPTLFGLLLRSRETAVHILQNRQRSLSDRLAVFVSFACRLDGCLDRPKVAQAICTSYENENYVNRQLIRIRRLRRWGTMTHARQVLLAMEHLTEAFPHHVRELEATDVDKNVLPLEQLSVYYVFRWWLKAACDGKLWRQAAAAAVSVLAVSGLARTMGSVKEAARLYGKEVEHSDDNLALLRRAMELPQFSRDRLLQILEVPHAI